MDESNRYQLKDVREIFSIAPFGIGVFDRQSREPIFLNEAYYKLVGYTPEEYTKLIANQDQKLIFPDDRLINQKNTEAFSSHGIVSNARFRIVTKNKKVCWVDLCIIPITISEKKYALCFFEDITNEKEQFAQLKLVAESIGNSICVLSIKKGKEELLYANETFFNLIGVKKDVYLKDVPTFDKTFTSEEDRIKTRNAIEVSLKTGIPQEVEYRFFRPGAEPLWMNRRLSIIKGYEEDSYLMVSIVTDITEKKQAEIKTALEQRRYQIIVDEMKAAVFEWDLKNGGFYCSDSYQDYAMSKAPPDIILANKGPKDIIHPDDRLELEQFFSRTASGEHRVESVLRMRMTAGGYCWCKLIGLYYHDENGKPTRTIGMIININEEREKSFMLNSLLNELPGGVAVFKIGQQLECQYYNDGFAKLSKRTRIELDEIIENGKLLQTIIAPPDLERFMETISRDTILGEQINITFRYLNKYGETGWLHMNGSKLKEDNDYPVYYCVFTSPTDEAQLYRSIVEDSAIGVFIGERKNRRIVYGNKMIRQIYHLDTESHILGKNLFDIISPDRALFTDEEIAALPFDRYVEYHWHHEDHYYSVKAKALIWNGIDSYSIYLSDETQEHQKKMQQDELLNLVPTGVAIYEIRKGQLKQIYMNDGYYRLVGESREQRSKYRNEFKRLIHSQDVMVIDDAVKRCMEGSQQESVDHRIMCGDGEYRWFRLSASVVKREADCITIYCNYTNIDDAVKTKIALENANKNLQKQYNQELYQRQMLEKDSMVAVQFNVTKDKLISYRVNQGLVKQFALGTAGTAIRPEIFGDAPTEEERTIVKDFFDRDKALERFNTGTTEFFADYRRRLNTGRLCWIRSTCRLAKDADTGDIISYTYMHNIDAERKKELTAESVIDEETDFVLLLNTVSDTAMLLRLKNDYQGFGGKLYQDFPFENALDKGELDIVYPEDREMVRSFYQKNTIVERLKKEPVITITYRQRLSEGTIRRKKARAFYLDETKEDIVIARRDITDIYEEEQEQKRTLEAALAAVTSANNSKSDFLSRMSHDLRTPMNVIMGLSSLAMDSINDPVEIEKALSNITNSSKYLLGLINDCLDLEKINSGKIELHAEPYPYVEFYNDMKAVIEPLCIKKNITLVMEEIGHVQPVIVADKTRFEQIFYNLLSNAVKFTPEGGKVGMLTHNIVIENNYVTFDSIVKDDGIGMSKEFQKQMFEPFSQERNDVTPEYQGTGLGLAIVKQLVELMGGKIMVKSKKNAGTEYRIRFRFPIVDKIETVKEVKTPTWTEILQGKRVLLVEDHPLNRLIAQKQLEKSEIRVTAVENGEEAVEHFSSVAVDYFAAILMDIRMPIMNGLEATKAIRKLKRPDAKKIPIIAMTANAFDTDIEKSLAAGMNAHLSKPIEPQELYETLAKLLSKEKK